MAAELLSILAENKGMAGALGALVIIILAIMILKWFQEVNSKIR